MKYRILFCLCVMGGIANGAAQEDVVPPQHIRRVKETLRQPVLETVDLSVEKNRHVIIAEGDETAYHGHPTTVLLPDGKTMFCVWTYGHGGSCGPLKKSTDGGLTWSDMLSVPESWRRAHNCPTLYRLVDPRGQDRLFVFSQMGAKLNSKRMVQSYSVDNGRSWTPMRENGLGRLAMPFTTIVPIENGQKLLALSNIRRMNDLDPRSNCVAQSVSRDGGLTWSPWRVVCDLPGLKPCEPCLIRAPDGRQWVCLMRENSRRVNSLAMVSQDEGANWPSPFELPGDLTGDRHVGRYDEDGRLVIVFRDMAPQSRTRGHFVAWIGRYEDIIKQRAGQYRVKLLHSHAGSDCGYPGLERLPDGTFVATTYVKYAPGNARHSIVSVHFQLRETDAMAGRLTASSGEKD